MKRLVTAILSLVVVLILSGCAVNGTGYTDNGKVKCPACGYEFNAPSDA